jgi:WS/DGAT/MGAT family acyltransferase
MHIASVGMYDGPISLQDLFELVQSRLPLIPRYRQRVVFPPFSVAHPTWEDDPDFDLRRHVEEVTLPDPADDVTLSNTLGNLHACMLDRQHPLWKLVLIQGHERGGSALLTMVHHAMVDGISGVEVNVILHDINRRPASTQPAPSPWTPRPLPDAIDLLQDAVRERMTETVQMWTDESFRLFNARETEKRVRELTAASASSLTWLLQPAPLTPFNGQISGERRYAWTRCSFADVRAVRSALGGTVNDVVVTVLAGALARYLRHRGYPTSGVELRAMCPVSMRGLDERGSLGNLVSMMVIPLLVGISDPLERFAAERAAVLKLKQEDQAGYLYAMTELTRNVPPAMQSIAGMFNLPNTVLNTVSTNVPGPQIPLFLNGRELLEWCPMGPVSNGIGLFVATLTYNQALTFGFTVDAKLVPDVWRFAGFMAESFAELQQAAGVTTRPESGARAGQTGVASAVKIAKPEGVPA